MLSDGCQENIVYLVGRADALSTTFYLLALIAYLLALKKQQMGLRSYALFAMLNVLSGLCTETSTAGFLLSPKFWYRKGHKRDGSDRR